MTKQQPRIVSLNPIVFDDNRRVTLEMVVEGLPDLFANVSLMMPEFMDKPPMRPAKAAANTPSPYPNIELSILNGRREQIKSLLIVEHKEQFTALTMHLPFPDLQEQYTARAEMSYQEEIVDVVEAPFALHPFKT
jgi:hypothetical protein